MAFNNISELIFDVEYYRHNASLSEARDLMYYDICEFIQMLMKNERIAVIRDMDEDLVKVEFNLDDNKLKSSAKYPIWLTKEERRMIEEARKKEEERILKLP